MRIQLLSIPALLALSEVSAAEPQDGGYVFRKGEGETVCCDSLVKASPKQGTSGGVAILQRMPKDFSTGLHYHIRADEFFYVVSGMGVATIGEKEYAIQEGDFVFVHAGEDHKLQS